MSLTFPTTTLKKPSGLTAIPSGFKRPSFGTLYGFDAQEESSGFNIDLRDTHSNIIARSGDAVGTIAFATDTYDLYVFDGANWYFYDYNSTTAFSSTLSASFDGTDDSIEVSSNPNLDVYTCSLWFKTAETYFSLPIAGFGKNGSQYGGIRFVPVVAGRAVEFNDGLQYIAAGGLSNSDVFDDEWHHVAIVYVASGYTTSTGTASNNGQGYKIFVDGARVDTVVSLSSHNFSLATTSSFFSVGKERTSFYDGLIDEVAIFGSSLSDANIATIYNSGVPADLSGFSPTLWWRMGENDSGSDGATIGTVTDQGSGGNNATGTNGPTYSSTTP